MSPEDELRYLRGLKAARASGDAELEAALMEKLQPQSAPTANPNAPLQHDFEAMEMFKNIPGDAAAVGEQILQMVSSPIDTAEGLWNVTSGFAQKLWPGDQDNEKYANAMMDDIANKYGGIEEFQRQLQNHPVETALDVSSLLTGGAGAARMAGVKGAKAVQSAVDLPGAAVRGTRAGWAKMRGADKPRELWESAIKPSTVMDYRDRAKVADTALRERLMPTKGGMAKLRRTKEVVYGKVLDLIEEADATGRKFTPGELSNEVRKLQAEWKKSSSPGSAGNVASLRKFMNKWDLDLKRQKKRGERDSLEFTPSEVQQIKQDLYKEINYDKLNQKGVRAVEETQAALARGAKNRLEEMSPELAATNRRWGDLADLEPILERAQGRISNRDVMGIGVGVNTAGGGAFGGMPGAAAAGTAAFLDRPLVKAMRAQRLYDALQPGFLTTPGVPFGLLGHNLGYLQDYSELE
ncbi:MAG: hypothetical protein KJN90_06505 [Gammaproteobacteria bacterium]|nr:hypothetical protein [Gammaproteobacteria bacterium]